MCFSFECTWAIILGQFNKTWRNIIHAPSSKSLAWLLNSHETDMPSTSKPLKLAVTFKQEGFVWVWIKLNYLHPLLTTLFNLWWNRFSGNSTSITKLLATSGFKGVYAIDSGIEGPTTWPVCFSLFFPIIIPLFSLHDSLCSSF